MFRLERDAGEVGEDEEGVVVADGVVAVGGGAGADGEAAAAGTSATRA